MDVTKVMYEVHGKKDSEAARASPWEDGRVTEQSWQSATEWLPLPDVADLLGESVSRVRSLIDDQALIALPIDGVRKVPAVFFLDGELLSSLRGTIFVLHDAGFSDEEALQWLLSPEESIGTAPIDALRAGRKTEVRRVAQTLA